MQASADKWHARFLSVAALVASWSKDPSTRVGAVIVDPATKAILSTGFNGLPRGVADHAERLADRDWKLAATAHAELNAIMHAARFGHRIAGATMYVTLSPCAHCAAAIIQSGIAAVVRLGLDWPDRWRDSFARAEQMLREAGVQIIDVHPAAIEKRLDEDGSDPAGNTVAV